jgi:hypothetical protein
LAAAIVLRYSKFRGDLPPIETLIADCSSRRVSGRGRQKGQTTADSEAEDE